MNNVHIMVVTVILILALSIFIGIASNKDCYKRGFAEGYLEATKDFYEGNLRAERIEENNNVKYKINK